MICKILLWVKLWLWQLLTAFFSNVTDGNFLRQFYRLYCDLIIVCWHGGQWMWGTYHRYSQHFRTEQLLQHLTECVKHPSHILILKCVIWLYSIICTPLKWTSTFPGLLRISFITIYIVDYGRINLIYKWHPLLTNMITPLMLNQYKQMRH